ncbi:hypothetical protein GCM10028824_13140 [Hymenobacter segetis]
MANSGRPGGAVTEAWVARYNGLDYFTDEGEKVVVDRAGDVYVTGRSFSNSGSDYGTIKYDGRTGRQLWAARYSDPGYSDPTYGNDYPTGLALDASGALYVTGYSFNGTNYDYVTIKYNQRTGAQVWLARYDGSASFNDLATAVAVDAAGTPYVTGYSSTSGSGLIDYVTIKYDPRTGLPLWVASYNGPNNTDDYAYALAISSNNDVYVSGSSYGPTAFDYATVKYDGHTGSQRWASRYNGPASFGEDRVTSLSLDAAGNAFVTGYSYNGQNYDFATVKYDRRTGQQRWVTRFNGPANADDMPAQMVVDAAGDAYVAGTSFNAANRDYATVKYDGRTGQQRWISRYNGPGNSLDGATGVALDAAGQVYVTGYSSNSDFTLDYATLQYDPRTGRQIWAARYNGLGNRDDVARALAVSPGGNVYVTGSSYSGSSSGDDFVTVKYESRRGHGHDHDDDDDDQNRTTPSLALEAYPNPAATATAIRFRLPAAGPVQVQVYNQFGTLVATLQAPAPTDDAWQTLPLPTDNLPNGVYLCRLLHDNQVEQVRLQVQH